MAMSDAEPELNINFHGKQFTGSTVGIVGMGRIGLTGKFSFTGSDLAEAV